MNSSTRYNWQLLRAGPLKLDGGGMFGLVPRVVWSKVAPPDERGRIEIAHNCLLLSRNDDPSFKIVIETGSGDKFDARSRDIFGLTDRSIVDAVEETGTRLDEIANVIVTHLHFDHAGGLTRRSDSGPALTFPLAKVIVQKQEWEDAIANNSVMTRTYLAEHLDPIRDHLHLIESPSPYPAMGHPSRLFSPTVPLEERMTEVLPGVFVFLVPGHTWGQQAVLFTDTTGQRVVFVPDVLPTAWHVGAAYSLSYDVEPYTSMLSRRWFLEEAVQNDWLLVLDHEPGEPRRRACKNAREWFDLSLEDR
ncbi:MAG: MBL fold metallo-hydrolase [Tepidisphaeraceae bacterium]